MERENIVFAKEFYRTPNGLYNGPLPEYEINEAGIMVLCKACDKYLELLSTKEKVAYYNCWRKRIGITDTQTHYIQKYIEFPQTQKILNGITPTIFAESAKKGQGDFCLQGNNKKVSLFCYKI